MSIELARRIKALEAKVAELEAKSRLPRTNPLMQEMQKLAEKQEKPREMCPKCGVKPNYFFHVKHCQGQKQKDDDRRRDQSTP